MTHRRRLAGLALIATTGLAHGCREAAGPRRVPDDGAPCSVMMPGAPEMGQVTFTLGGVTVRERSWGLRPSEVPADPATPVARYVVRRATLPPNAPVRDAALLDAAAKRVARGLELAAGDGSKPAISKVATPSGEAIDLRWPAGPLRNATRLLLIPSGFCEATVTGAGTDADVEAFLGSVQAGSAGKP